MRHVMNGHDLKSNKIASQWLSDKERATHFHHKMPSAFPQSLQWLLCSASNVSRNSSGELFIPVNWLAWAINPRESLVKNWWAIEIKRGKQTATDQMNKWCFFSLPRPKVFPASWNLKVVDYVQKGMANVIPSSVA